VELLFAVLGGIVIGAVAHLIAPRRSLRGALLGPALGGIVAAVLWEVLTWSGWRPGDTWIWVVSLVAAGVVPLVAERVVGRRREHADDEYFSSVAGLRR